MNMKLTQLCDSMRKEPRPIRTDSRLVEEGDIFVALPPAAREGAGAPDLRSEYIRAAAARGAGVIVADPRFSAAAEADREQNAPDFIPASDARTALGRIASAVSARNIRTFPSSR